MRASRWLAVASTLVGAWIAIAFACATPVLAHGGHNHAVNPTINVQISLAPDAPDAVATSVARNWQPIDWTPELGDTGDLASSVRRSDTTLGATAIAAVATVTGSKGGSHCICNGACGSCTPLSCCAVIIPQLVDDALIRLAKSLVAPETGLRMQDSEVAPLPRPPNPPLLA